MLPPDLFNPFVTAFQKHFKFKISSCFGVRFGYGLHLVVNERLEVQQLADLIEQLRVDFALVLLTQIGDQQEIVVVGYSLEKGYCLLMVGVVD